MTFHSVTSASCPGPHLQFLFCRWTHRELQRVCVSLCRKRNLYVEYGLNGLGCVSGGLLFFYRRNYFSLKTGKRSLPALSGLLRRLRQKMAKNELPDPVENIRGRGFRLLPSIPFNAWASNKGRSIKCLWIAQLAASTTKEWALIRFQRGAPPPADERYPCTHLIGFGEIRAKNESVIEVRSEHSGPINSLTASTGVHVGGDRPALLCRFSIT